MARSAPSLAKATATTRPIPLSPPVIRATFPLNLSLPLLSLNFFISLILWKYYFTCFALFHNLSYNDIKEDDAYEDLCS